MPFWVTGMAFAALTEKVNGYGPTLPVQVNETLVVWLTTVARAGNHAATSNPRTTASFFTDSPYGWVRNIRSRVICALLTEFAVMATVRPLRTTG